MKNCVKCDGDMVKDTLHTLFNIVGLRGPGVKSKFDPDPKKNKTLDLITPYACKKCGYVKLYAYREE